YVPGWDCHGMPIEHAVEKLHGRDLPTEETLRLCRAFAEEQIERQRRDFVRLGVLGDWDDPYKTMNPRNEADEIRSLGRMLELGYVFRGLKSLNWCVECGSALAEAEVEYEDRTSTAIDFAYPLRTDQREALAHAFGLGAAPEGDILALAWTTTPWTLPGSQAISAHPEHEYELVATRRGHLLLARELREQTLERCGIAGQPVAWARGDRLGGLVFRHPFIDRDVPLLLGVHVTTDVGTGLVHTAPAPGVEDFDMGREHGLPLESPVLADGSYASHVPHVAGLTVRDVEPRILELLRSEGQLFAAEKYRHSYPLCWRHKTPIIFRATNQWFVGMDLPAGKAHETLRATALRGIEATRFFPAWGQPRLHAMIANRPDWCTSRQRQWGVPIPFFTHRETGELHPRTLELLEAVAQRVEAEGIEVWQRITAEEMLGAGDAALYEKSRDTLDVWFDSGTTHEHVMRGSHAGQSVFPADLYLEGSDQHRGWFHSSLLTSCAMNGVPPYRALLTHGFAVDGAGRKMSKSLGNVIAPQKVSDTLGSEILRLWVASTDYSGELSISDEILKRVVESYRRIRNTLRFLLANVADFDPKRHAVPVGELFEVDRYAMAMTAAMQAACEAEFERFEFHPVVARLQTFCSEDLGAFYLDILKDRLYTSGADSRARRSAQTALWHVTHALLRLMAPVLSFTAEEAWRIFAPDEWAAGGETIFTQTYYRMPAGAQAPALLEKWTRIRQWRGEVMKELEAVRTSGGIGSSLQAEVELHAAGSKFELLAGLGDDLRFVLITSAARLVRAAGEADERVLVMPSTHPKCERCWHWRADVGADAAHPSICGRCVANLHGEGEARRFA
ncbi:MAG: isoleucine--tRNA ligase, partial [Burkholderiales bacterium]